MTIERYKGRAKHIIESLMAAGHTRADARLILTNAVAEGRHKPQPEGGNPDAHQISRQVARRQAMGRINLPSSINRISESRKLRKARTSPVYKHPSLGIKPSKMIPKTEPTRAEQQVSVFAKMYGGGPSAV